MVISQPSGRPAGQPTSRPPSAASGHSLQGAGLSQLPRGMPTLEDRMKKRNRESYMEAISMGSLNEQEGRYSRTSEPIDL